jgi:hypothetical protein
MTKVENSLLAAALAAGILFAAGIPAVGAMDPGDAQLEVFGGFRGPVPFPHLEHQERLQDCLVCHSVFPQEKDAIKTLKESGKLKKKKVMNQQCVGCHRAEKKAGNPSGPTTCATCHVRVNKK